MGLQDQVGGSNGTEANLIHGLEQGIAAGHPLQALFKPRLTADPLEITVHQDRAILPPGPAQGHG